MHAHPIIHQFDAVVLLRGVRDLICTEFPITDSVSFTIRNYTCFSGISTPIDEMRALIRDNTLLPITRLRRIGEIADLVAREPKPSHTHILTYEILKVLATLIRPEDSLLNNPETIRSLLHCLDQTHLHYMDMPLIHTALYLELPDLLNIILSSELTLERTDSENQFPLQMLANYYKLPDDYENRQRSIHYLTANGLGFDAPISEPFSAPLAIVFEKIYLEIDRWFFYPVFNEVRHNTSMLSDFADAGARLTEANHSQAIKLLPIVFKMALKGESVSSENDEWQNLLLNLLRLIVVTGGFSNEWLQHTFNTWLKLSPCPIGIIKAFLGATISFKLGNENMKLLANVIDRILYRSIAELDYNSLFTIVHNHYANEHDSIDKILRDVITKYDLTIPYRVHEILDIADFLVAKGADPIILKQEYAELPYMNEWLAKHRQPAIDRRMPAVVFYLANHDEKGFLHKSTQDKVRDIYKSSVEKLESKVQALVDEGRIIWHHGHGVEESKTPEEENLLHLDVSTTLLNQARIIADHLQPQWPAQAAEWRELIAEYEKPETKRLVVSMLAPET
ncbi:MAG: hypothetical protein Q7V63_01510 [Gammaproteobacteria bacterium]|nr:hypothetical protein [Gammaproteobacteria bacterium]